MPGNKFLGLLLIVIGVVANNYVYLHDLVIGKGVIMIGLYSWLGVFASLAIIVVGLLVAVRAKRGALVSWFRSSWHSGQRRGPLGRRRAALVMPRHHGAPRS